MHTLVKQDTNGIGPSTRATIPSQGSNDHFEWRGGRALLYLGFVCTLFAGCATRHAAPDVASAQSGAGAGPERGRLTVRHSMATGTKTVGAGVQRLDSLYPGDPLLEQSYIYVPKRCLGTKRYPLVVLLHGSGGNGHLSIVGDDGLFMKYADSLGYILLAPTGRTGNWDIFEPNSQDTPMIDAPMRTMLEHYAIDPERIILMGGSAGSGGALYLGYVNGDVFSHVIGFEAWQPFGGAHDFDSVTAHGKAQFFFAMSKEEGAFLKLETFIPWMQSKGYTAAYALDNGTHAMTWERGKVGYDWLTSAKGWR